MNSRYCLTFKSTFQPEKPKKLENYFFYVKIFDWNYLHLTAQTKETYFSHANAFVAAPATSAGRRCSPTVKRRVPEPDLHQSEIEFSVHVDVS